MKIADRRRFRRGSGQREVEPTGNASPQGAGPGTEGDAEEPHEDVIRASTLNRVPDWARIPPITPSLPEMPVVVSRHFDDSLASWQPPEKFLAPLVHSLSPDAPSGAVEGLAQLTEPVPTAITPPAEEPAALHRPELVLAVAHATDAVGSGPTATSRRIERFFETAQTGAGPLPPQEPTLTADAELQTAAVPPATPMVAVPNPLLHAPVPPDMPLPRLTATERIPERTTESDPRPADNNETAPTSPRLSPAGPSDGPSRPVAQREIDVTVRRDPLAIAPALAEEQTVEPVSELPLASPHGAPRSSEKSSLPQPSESLDTTVGFALKEVEAPSSTTEPVSFESPHPAEAVGSPAGAEPIVDLQQPASDPVNTPEPAVVVDAPLLGDAAPLVRDVPSVPVPPESADRPAPSDQDAAPRPVAAPVARRRVGIGAPMSGLPPTSASWDVTSMTPAQQRQTSRALVQSQMARNIVGAQRSVEGPAQTGQPLPSSSPPVAEAAPQPVLAGTELPVVGYRSLPPALSGKLSTDIPPPSEESVDLLSPNRFSEAETREAPASEPEGTLEGRGARSYVGSRYGMDLSTVPVDRSPESAGAARNIRARAFTSDRAVVVPASAGTLESGSGEALLAHELTHVAQRARHGAHLPAEATPAGRLLEAEALAVEMSLPAASHRAAPLVRSEPPAATTVSRRIAPGVTQPPPAELPLASSTSASLDPDVLAATLIERMSSVPAPGSPGRTETFTAAWAPAPVGPSPTAQVVQRAEEGTNTMVAPPAALDLSANQQSAAPLTRPSDEELTKLSQWLYPLIRYRLKGELREDRERAGLLTDHYRRW